MNRKISRFNMDKSGQSYDIEPRGFSAFKADVLRRIASIQSQIDMLNGQTPSSGSGSSSGGSSSGSGSSSSSSSGTTGSGGTVRNFTFKSNRKNTTVTVRYKKRDDTWVEKTATIPKIDTNYVVCSESSTQINDEDEFTYTAIFKGNDGTVLEEITGSARINDIKYNPIVLSFNEVDTSGYYLRVVGAESTPTGFKYVINENGGKIRVVVESNIRYSVCIYPRTDHWPNVPEDYAFFTVNGIKYTDTVRLSCSGDQTFELDIAPYVYEPDISELGPRNEDIYSMNEYEYGASSIPFIRMLYFDIQIIDQNCGDSVSAQNGHILQYSRYVKDENQEVEMRMSNDIRNGYLNGCGGSFTFQIKPKTYWYIRSEIEEGLGTPNALTFSPAEGNPSNDWIDITVSWTGDGPGLPYNTRGLLMQICSVIGNEVICEKKFDGVKNYTHKWRTLPKFLNNDPSGELQSGDKVKGVCSHKAWKNWGDSVLNSFVGVGFLPDGTSYPNNYLTINRDSKVLYIYVKSHINYKLNTNTLPDCLRDQITYEYSPNTNYYAPEGTEGKPGQHIYKVTIPENTTGTDRELNIEFISMNPKYTGSTISHITQKGTYKDNIDPTNTNYSLIQETAIWAFKDKYNSSSIHVISKKPFVIANETSKSSSVFTYCSEYTFENMCPATDEFQEINLTNITLRLYVLYNDGVGDMIWGLKIDEPLMIKPVIG